MNATLNCIFPWMYLNTNRQGCTKHLQYANTRYLLNVYSFEAPIFTFLITSYFSLNYNRCLFFFSDIFKINNLTQDQEHSKPRWHCLLCYYDTARPLNRLQGVSSSENSADRGTKSRYVKSTPQFICNPHSR